MPSAPRIVVVDTTYDVVRIVRGALVLLNRPHTLVEAPSSDAVLEEIARSSVDLVVTAYQILGDMHGIELATRVCHESLGTSVIVLADEGDPHLDEGTLADAPYQYFVRPVAEPFLRGLRIALDGEAAIAAEADTVAPGVDLGPVPGIDVDELRNIIVPLMRDVGAMGVILADRTGRVLVDEGATGYIDRERLAAILGPAFSRSVDISPLVGGNAWTMHYYDGERLDVFGLSLGMHYFMGLIFEGSNRGAFGAVTMFGRRAADQMIEMIGEAAFQLPKTGPLPEEKEAVAEPATSAAAKKTKPKKAEVAEKPPEKPALEPVTDFDPEILFGQAIDETLADSMFDPEALSDIALTLAADEDERVGYDEAIDMGILDE